MKNYTLLLFTIMNLFSYKVLGSTTVQKQITYKGSSNNISMKKGDILFIHGFPMSKKIWEPQLNALREKYNCYAIDLPGYGDNTASNNFTHSIDSYADYIHGYLLENKIENVHIVGMSMGGSVALNFSRRYPNSVKSITLIHTSAIVDTEQEKKNRDSTIAEIENGKLKIFIENFADRLLSPQTNSSIRNKYASDMLEANQNIVIAGYKAIRNRPNEFIHLKKIKVPVLLIAGNDDIGSSPQEMQEMSNEISNSTFKIIKDCGHVAPLEQPVILNKILLKWFKNQIKL